MSVITGNMRTSEYYKNALAAELKNRYHFNYQELETALGHFDEMINIGRQPEGSMGAILYCYGSTEYSFAENVKTMDDVIKNHRSMKQIIEDALHKINTEHEGISRDPRVRLQKKIKTLNDNIKKCAILVDDLPFDDVEPEKLKVVIPDCLKLPMHEFSATASSKNFEAPMTLLVKF
jgi:hypothetical protein